MYILGQPYSNSRAVRVKDGKMMFVSGAYNATLGIDGLSADRTIGIDNADGSMMVKGASVINWSTISINTGALTIGNPIETVVATTTGTRVGSSYLAVNQTSGSLRVIAVKCATAGQLTLTVVAESAAAGYTPAAQVVAWAQLN